MTTATKSRGSAAAKSAAAKKAAAAKKETPAPEVTETPAPEAKEPKAPSKPAYRNAEGFTDALKSAKGVAKGNADLTQPLQLITHLAWKSPAGKVGWAEGTTASVMAYADDIAVPEGTAIPEALAAALSAADKGAADKPQKDAVAVLAKVINGHTA
jgi:hypothetical protein